MRNNALTTIVLRRPEFWEDLRRAIATATTFVDPYCTFGVFTICPDARLGFGWRFRGFCSVVRLLYGRKGTMLFRVWHLTLPNFQVMTKMGL
jgi:hypothetical protein